MDSGGAEVDLVKVTDRVCIHTINYVTGQSPSEFRGYLHTFLLLALNTPEYIMCTSVAKLTHHINHRPGNSTGKMVSSRNGTTQKDTN
jgi:hypothetical protein